MSINRTDSKIILALGLAQEIAEELADNLEEYQHLTDSERTTMRAAADLLLREKKRRINL